jgi:DNA-binding transcriptional MocR family regulator
MEASRKALRVAWALASFARGPAEWVCVRQMKLAERLGYAAETVRRALRELRQAGLVESRARYHNDGGQGASEYRLTFQRVEAPPKQQAPEPAPPPSVPNPLRELIEQIVGGWARYVGGTGWADVNSGRSLAIPEHYPDGRVKATRHVSLPQYVRERLAVCGYADLRQREVDRLLRDLAAEPRELLELEPPVEDPWD